VNPRALLIARTDFWPEMLTQARARHIPLHVFSFTQKALRNGQSFARWRTNLVDIIECVSEDDRRELSMLGTKARVDVGGDTRYDQVRYRLDHPKTLPSALKPSGPCLVAGSTWSEDEHVLLPALASLLREGKLKLILVPHEPTEAHIEALRGELRMAGLTYELYSSQQSWDDKHVLLVDKVGVLAELYLWGDLAFVGGSYRKSVHSVMEALGAGCLTFVGPKHTGNREALEFKALTLPSGARPLLEAKDADQLRTLVEGAIVQATPKFKQELVTEFDRRLGASQRLIDRIGKFLEA
jgi:3-deoxy-D-manno-octulosonic-acid transferase